ncbi:MAG: FGGY-family carbohydrate kinase [Candidatus Humimicrobiaceae bacterium]
MQECIIGTDMCGTNMKVGAFTVKGERLYVTGRKNIPIVTPEGHYYFNWKYQRDMLFEMLKEIIDLGYKILSIGVGSCGEAVYPLNKSGEIIHNAIAWYCTRTEEQAKEFSKKISEEEVYEICHLKPFFTYSAHKINWFKKYKPEVYKNAACWLNVDGFVNYILTGTKYMDYNQAGSTLLFDTKKRDWSDKLFELNEISKDTFPKLIESGKFTGNINSDIKKILGVDYDIPVSLSGHDSWCGLFALGVGISDKIEFTPNFTGTAGLTNVGKIIDKEELLKTDTKDLYDNFSWVIPHVYPNKYHCRGNSVACYGALIEFILKILFNEDNKEFSNEDYLRFEKEVNSSIPGSNGVRIYVSENEIKSTKDIDSLNGINILNLKTSNTKGDIYRAVLEYLSLMDKKQLENLERITGKKKKLLILGGITKNKAFMKIRASILNRTQYIAKEEEVNLLGAALLGGVGANIYKDYDDAIGKIDILYKDSVDPDPELVEQYSKIFNLA